MNNKHAPALELAAFQFAWFKTLCAQAAVTVAKDVPGSPALVVLAMGEDIGKVLAERYDQMSDAVESDAEAKLAKIAQTIRHFKSTRHDLSEDFAVCLNHILKVAQDDQYHS